MRGSSPRMTKVALVTTPALQRTATRCAVSGERLQPGRPQLHAGALQMLRQAGEQRLAVSDRVVELLQRNVEGGQCAQIERALFEAAQRLAQDGVSLRLHPVQLLGGLARTRRREHIEQPRALRRIAATLVLPQIAGKPGADRT